MAPNKRKILEAARKHAQKGNSSRALKEYEKLLKLDPRDAKLRLEIGDSHRRWGQVDEAIAAYSKVADQYMSEGFDARAVAVYKQIQNLDADRFESYVPLADLYQRMGLASEAIQALQTAADGFHKQGKKREALELLRKMATLDPSNTTSRIKVADLLRQEDMNDEAISEYEAALEELGRQGESDAAGTVLERILEIDSNRVATIVALSKNLLGRGQAARAEPFVKRAIEIESGDASHYELLADIYRAQQRDEEMADTYRTLADLYRQRGDEEKAREIIQRFAPPEFSAPLEPDTGEDLLLNQEEPALLEEDLLDDGAVLDGEAVLRGGDVLEDEIALDEAVDLVDPARSGEPLLDLSEEMPELTGAPTPVEPEPDTSPVEGDPDEVLAEASVYLRYGKRDQAVRKLEAILEQVPGHRGALEKLGDAHADGGDRAAAVDAWRRAAEQAQADGDDPAVSMLRDRVQALDAEAVSSMPSPAPPEPEEELIDLGDEEISVADVEPDEVSEDLGLDDIEIDLDDGSLDMEAEEPAPTTEVELDAGDSTTLEEAAAEASMSLGDASISSSQQIQEELDEAEFYRQQGLFDEAEAIYQRVLQEAPNHPMAMVRLGEIQAERGGDPSAAASPAPAAQAPDLPPTKEETPAFEADADAELDDWTDDGLSDSDLGLDDAAEEAASPAAIAETEEIEVELPDVDLDDDIGLDEEPEIELPEVELPDVDLDDDVASEELSIGATKPDMALQADLPEEVADESVALEPEDEPLLTDAPDEPLLPDPPEEPVSVEAPEESVAEELAADSEGESFDDLLLEANDDEKEDTPDPAGESFDLAAELAGALDDGESQSSSTGSLASMNEQDIFSAVFSEFKKGVDEALGEGDHEAHYDLGIAYREMGLLDDALGEFATASHSPARHIDGLHMMGLCALDLGRVEDAVLHLQAALDTPDIGNDQTLAVRFELGRAFEAQEDLGRAREAWEAVAAVDPSFCEVQERLATLGEEKPEPEAESGLESFDDLFEDDDEDDGADADGDSGSAEAEAGESFDDLIAEANAADDAEDSTDEISISEPEPEPEPAPEPAAEKKPRRRKKKISFV